ncbi:MAG: CvpA family protein [Prevotella sp.]|nr:CvpA family protein [Prevotella sp.]
MRVGLIADIIVAILIIVNLLVCTRRGLVRCLVSTFSTILALVVALLTVSPLTEFFDRQFGWVAAVENWHVPFISANTLLKLMIGIAVFVLVRLVCILVDKLLQLLKEKLPVINVLDRILGTVFGAATALVELSFLFLLFDTLNWTGTLGLTADGGGYFAYHVFNFCHNYLFSFLTNIFSVAAETLPKI